MFGPWLTLVARAWRMRADAAFAQYGLSAATGAALVHVHRLGGGIRQTALARYMGIEGPSLVRLLDHLCATGLVERRDDAEDRRAKTLHLTSKGRALAERVERVLDEIRAELLANVSEADLAATIRTLAAIATATGTALPDFAPVRVEEMVRP
jgi:MarR family transcriptional regulator for hemolysin